MLIKSVINTFYIEFDENWTVLAKQITDVNKEKATIVLKGVGPYAFSWSLCINDDDFRETWRLLDTRTKMYTTLHTKVQRPKKVIYGYSLLY